MNITIGDIARLSGYAKSLAEILPITDISRDYPISEEVYNDRTLEKFRAQLAALTDDQCKQLASSSREIQRACKAMLEFRVM